MPAVGILFDIDALGGFYGYEAYRIFFSSLNPRLLERTLPAA